MRYSTGWLVIAALQGTATLLTPAHAQSNQCLLSDCFQERQIRDFEVIDRDTLIVYVGRDRCPYRIEVDELYCNLTFLPEVEFFDRRTNRIEAVMRGRGQSNNELVDEINDDITVGGGDRGTGNRRVCTYSTSLALRTQGFAEGDGGLPPGETSCRIRSIDTVTDDQLLELFVDEDLILPPPPIGIGDISRADDPDAEPINGTATEEDED